VRSLRVLLCLASGARSAWTSYIVDEYELKPNCGQAPNATTRNAMKPLCCVDHIADEPPSETTLKNKPSISIMNTTV